MGKDAISVVFNPQYMKANRFSNKESQTKELHVRKVIIPQKKNSPCNTMPSNKMNNRITNRYKDIFDKYHIPMEMRHQLLVEYQAEISIIRNQIEIHCREDMWQILLEENSDEVCLMHNNYTRNFFGERYFGDGYHRQLIADKTLTGALQYIMHYDYDRLHNPKKVAIENITEMLTEGLEKALD